MYQFVEQAGMYENEEKCLFLSRTVENRSNTVIIHSILFFSLSVSDVYHQSFSASFIHVYVLY